MNECWEATAFMLHTWVGYLLPFALFQAYILISLLYLFRMLSLESHWVMEMHLALG